MTDTAQPHDSKRPDDAGQPDDAEQPEQQQPITPSRHDRLRPLELLGFAAVLALFAGGVVLYSTQGWRTLHGWAVAGIFAGIGFIVALLVLALLGLGGKPSKEDLEARKDLRTPDNDPGKGDWH